MSKEKGNVEEKVRDMYIIQIADLHTGSKNATEPLEDRFIKESIEEIKKNIIRDLEILFCICGDIIDSCNLAEDDHEETKLRYEHLQRLIMWLWRLSVNMMNLIETYMSI